MKLRASKVQEKILDCIREAVCKSGYPPTRREIAKNCGISSTGSVNYHIDVLAKLGVVMKDSHYSRGIRLSGSEAGIPILGRVAAGVPVTAHEHVEGYIDPASLMIGKKGMFALKIRGDSMLEAGILEGDIAIVHEQSSALNRDIVVAMVEDEATIKYFYRDKESIRLEPANSNYTPIIGKNIKVIGKVIKIIRNYH